MRLILPLLVLLALLAPSVASAKPAYRVGMGDQNPAMFDNPSFKSLGLKRIRYIVPWDGARDPAQRGEIAAFMNAALAARKEVFVAFSARRGCFTGRYSTASRCRAPSASAFRSAFRAFRAAYPTVKTYSAWNEVNHVSQPTYRSPTLAARYWDVLRVECRGCRLVALDVLDSSNMVRYTQDFLRRAKGTPKVFGIHNYADVNRRRTTATRALLRTVRGEVWMTETGGLVNFLPSFPYSPSRAASRTREMFKLADAYDTRRKGMRSKVTRVYPYQWTGVPRGSRFDAGLVNPDGTPRPAFAVFRSFVRNRLK